MGEVTTEQQGSKKAGGPAVKDAVSSLLPPTSPPPASCLLCTPPFAFTSAVAPNAVAECLLLARLERGRERGKGAGPATHLPPIQNNCDGGGKGKRRSTQQAGGERRREERGAQAVVLPSSLPARRLLARLPGWHAHNKMGGGERVRRQQQPGQQTGSGRG